MADTQKGPEQERCRDQDGAMKERFEIVLCQRGKQTVRRQRLCRPKENWSEQRSNDNDADKIGCQFSCVFQGG